MMQMLLLLLLLLQCARSMMSGSASCRFEILKHSVNK